MQGAFNFNFYLAATAVAPLLYVTLILQGPFFEDSQRLAARLKAYRMRVVNINPIRYYSTVFLSTIWFYVIVIIVFAGLVSEGISLWALYYQSDSALMRKIVLWSMIGLLILLPIRPIAKIFKISAEGIKETEKASNDSDPSEEKLSTTPPAAADGNSSSPPSS